MVWLRTEWALASHHQLPAHFHLPPPYLLLFEDAACHVALCWIEGAAMPKATCWYRVIRQREILRFYLPVLPYTSMLHGSDSGSINQAKRTQIMCSPTIDLSIRSLQGTTEQMDRGQCPREKLMPVSSYQRLSWDRRPLASLPKAILWLVIFYRDCLSYKTN